MASVLPVKGKSWSSPSKTMDSTSSCRLMPGKGAGTGVAGVSTGPGQTRVVTGLAVRVGVSEGIVVSVTDLF